MLTRLSILFTAVLWLTSSQAQTYTVIDIQAAKFIDSSGVTYFMDTTGKALSGNYQIISQWEGMLQVQLENGLANGKYTQFNKDSTLRYSYRFEKGLQEGEQLVYHRNGRVRQKYETCLSEAHGEVIEYADDGRILNIAYFLKGQRIQEKKDFKKLYPTIDCRDTSQQISLEVIELPVSKQEKQLTIDTLKIEDQVAYMQGMYPPSAFGSSYAKLDSIKFVIMASDEINILHLTFDYKPADNEIAFFYGVVVSEKRRQYHFRLGKNVQKAIDKKQFDPIEIIRFLEHDIFGVNSFSGMGSYGALELEMKKWVFKRKGDFDVPAVESAFSI